MPDPPPTPSCGGRAGREHRRSAAAEATRFALTGLAAYGTDVVLFNLLLLGVGVPSTGAKIVSSAVAIAVAFAGSRYFTWAERRTDSPGREYALFVLFSVLAAGIQLACLVVSRDLLDLRSALADNVSANVVGMALATVFRFWTFRTYVFPSRGPSAARATTARDDTEQESD